MHRQNDGLLTELRDKIVSYNQKHIEAHSRGERYNIFEILGVESSELSHSAFIANLLNPDGTHALREKPLQLFIEKVCKDFSLDTFDLSNAVVRTEVPVDGKTEDEWGRMDIVVELSDECIIIIENKIYAADQLTQLRRYYDYAKKYQKHLLLYLTPDGRPASESSTDGLCVSRDYYRVSYRKEINEWLDECIGLAVQKPLVREILIQYRKTIESLVGMDCDAEERENVFRFILDNGEVLSEVLKLNDFNAERELIERFPMTGFFQYGLRDMMGKLNRFAKNKGLEVDFDSRLSGGRYCGFNFRKEGWNKTIMFQFTQPYWKGCYYGVHSLSEVDPGKRMSHLKYKPNEHYCYGNDYTEYKNWDTDGLISGEIKESIIDAVEQTLGHLKDHPEKYNME